MHIFYPIHRAWGTPTSCNDSTFCLFIPLAQLIAFDFSDTCTGQDLADLGDRLRDWFQLLHENAKQNSSGSTGSSPMNGKQIAFLVVYMCIYIDATSVAQSQKDRHRTV